MRNNKYQRIYNTPYQLKLPLEIEKTKEISDPVYTFCEVLNQIDLKRYLVVKENRTGRKRFDSETLLKVILFAFMEHGYVSTREIEKLCKTDIRFMYLMNEQSAPSHMTILPFYFALLYLHNILCTKSSFVHTCISNSHVCQISSMYFFP